MIKVKKASDSEILSISNMSKEWENENCTYGFATDTFEDLRQKNCWVAYWNSEIAGYIFGRQCTSKGIESIMPDGTQYFEIEGLYVKPEWRSNGVGSELMSFAERELKESGIQKTLLYTATNDYKKILHFYIEQMDMTFWCAQLFKNL